MTNKEFNQMVQALIDEKKELDNDFVNAVEDIRQGRIRWRNSQKALDDMPKEFKAKLGFRLRNEIKKLQGYIKHNNNYLDLTGSRKELEGKNKCNANGICDFKLQQIIDEERGGGIYKG